MNNQYVRWLVKQIVTTLNIWFKFCFFLIGSWCLWKHGSDRMFRCVFFLYFIFYLASLSFRFFIVWVGFFFLHFSILIHFFHNASSENARRKYSAIITLFSIWILIFLHIQLIILFVLHWSVTLKRLRIISCAAPRICKRELQVKEKRDACFAADSWHFPFLFMQRLLSAFPKYDYRFVRFKKSERMGRLDIDSIQIRPCKG